jgi:hypothetical protein
MIRRFTVELQQSIFNHVLDTNHVMDKADIQHIFAEHSRNIAEALEVMHTLWSTPLEVGIIYLVFVLHSWYIRLILIISMRVNRNSTSFKQKE